MKILIVEDDDNKRSQLALYCEELYKHLELKVARSLQSALKVVRNDTADVVLLDMTLPTYDVGPHEPGGSTHAFGGREFLKELRRFKRSTPVIVVTQFEAFGSGRELTTLGALDAELRSEFPSNYVGFVYYHAAIESWKPQLRSLLDLALSRTA